MMARRLKPHAERVKNYAPDSIFERTRPLLVHDRPPVKPSGKRATVAGSVASTDAQLAPPTLFGRVVTIDGEDDYFYFYVLTFLPDLHWCHVAPLRQNGVFASGGSSGRPRWMLLPEDEGGERDVGAGRCHVMHALEVKKTKANADEEE